MDPDGSATKTTGGNGGKAGNLIILRAHLARLAAVHLERGDEGRLGDLDVAHLAHPLLALLLSFQKLLLAADVATASSEHAIAEGQTFESPQGSRWH
jgi:hypothetical protein